MCRDLRVSLPRWCSQGDGCCPQRLRCLTLLLMMLLSGRAASPAGGEIDHRGAAPTQERGGGRTEEEGERGRKEGDGGEEKTGSTMHQIF